jgi:hypothetical protein
MIVSDKTTKVQIVNLSLLIISGIPQDKKGTGP